MRSSPESLPETRAIVHPAADVGVLTDVELIGTQLADMSPGGAKARLDGFREGRSEGLERGLVEGRTLGEQRVASAVQALGAAVAELRESSETTRAEVEALAIELALELAEAVIGREIESAADPGRDALSRALALRLDREGVRARMHPDDLALLSEMPGDVELIPDPAVSRGGAVVELGVGLVDATIGSALDRVREALR